MNKLPANPVYVTTCSQCKATVSSSKTTLWSENGSLRHVVCDPCHSKLTGEPLTPCEFVQPKPREEKVDHTSKKARAEIRKRNEETHEAIKRAVTNMSQPTKVTGSKFTEEDLTNLKIGGFVEIGNVRITKATFYWQIKQGAQVQTSKTAERAARVGNRLVRRSAK